MKTLLIALAILIAVPVMAQTKPKIGTPTIKQLMAQASAEYAKTDSLVNVYTKTLEQLRTRQHELMGYYRGLQDALRVDAPDTVKYRKEKSK